MIWLNEGEVTFSPRCQLVPMEDVCIRKGSKSEMYARQYINSFYYEIGTWRPLYPEYFRRGIHKKSTICPRCKIRKVDGNHHIIPRKYYGPDIEENFIRLCNKCHDIVEINTDDWIQSGRYYNMEILKSMIINYGFV